MEKIIQIYKAILLSDLSVLEKQRRIQFFVRKILASIFNYKIIQTIIVSMNQLKAMDERSVKLVRDKEILKAKLERGFEKFVLNEMRKPELQFRGSPSEILAVFEQQWKSMSEAEKLDYMANHNID